MRLSKKQKALSLQLFGSDRLTRRQFRRAMDEYKEASSRAYEDANDAELLDLASGYSELRKESMRYHVGPCPMSTCTSSDDGFFVDTSNNIGGCRKCGWQESGNGAGPVGFVAALHSLEPYEARDYILGREISVTLPKIEFKKRQVKTKAERERQDFSELVRDARDELASDSDLARWALGYFEERMIKPETLFYFGVGVMLQWGKPFVVMPFYSNVDMVLCGVGLRGQGRGKKSIKGSMFQDVSFGLDAVAGHPVAVVVEGEVNALSILQVLYELGIECDVLSVGTEAAFRHSIDHLVRTHLKHAKALVLWADKAEVGKQARDIVEAIRPDIAIGVLHSQEKEGQKGKTDANDLLIAGHLGTLLNRVLPDDVATLPTTQPADGADLRQEQPDTSDDDALTAAHTEAMGAMVTVTTHAPKVERGQEAREELLFLCADEAERMDNEEGDAMYRQVEDIFMNSPISVLFEHLQQMRALATTHTQAQLSL